MGFSISKKEVIKKNNNVDVKNTENSETSPKQNHQIKR